MADNHDIPGTPNAAHNAQAPAWQLVDDVLAGTKAIRKAGERYTPRAIGEEEDRYKRRLDQSRFYNLYRHVLNGLVGRVFRRAPVLDSDGSPTLLAHAEDITGTGVHLSVFARRAFRWSVHHGHSLIFIDAPAAPQITGRRPSLAEVSALGIRPYWVLVKAPQVVDFAVEYVRGREVLQMITIKEASYERVGRFREQAVVQYRVLEMRGGVPVWEVWREDEKSVHLHDSGTFLGIDQIPVVPCYSGEPIAPLHTEPMLYDVAEANLDHYAVQTRHTYNESVASNPIPVIKGRGLNDDPIPISVEHGIQLPVDGDAFWMEHSGSALNSTRESMRELEQRIALLGMTMMARRTNQAETAEAKRIDSMEAESRIAVSARGLQDALEQAALIHAQMVGEEPPSVKVNLDFDGLSLTPDQVRMRLDLYRTNVISIETLWDMLSEGGALPDNFNSDEEARRLAAAVLDRPPVDDGEDEEGDEESDALDRAA